MRAGGHVGGWDRLWLSPPCPPAKTNNINNAHRPCTAAPTPPAQRKTRGGVETAGAKLAGNATAWLPSPHTHTHLQKLAQAAEADAGCETLLVKAARYVVSQVVQHRGIHILRGSEGREGACVIGPIPAGEPRALQQELLSPTYAAPHLDGFAPLGARLHVAVLGQAVCGQEGATAVSKGLAGKQLVVLAAFMILGELHHRAENNSRDEEGLDRGRQVARGGEIPMTADAICCLAGSRHNSDYCPNQLQPSLTCQPPSAR